MSTSEFAGPPSHWFFGNTQQLRRDNIRFFLNMYREFGEIVQFKLGPTKILLVADSDVAYQILVKESSKFVKGERFWQDLDELVGRSIIRVNGDTWKRKRKLYAPSFHPSAIRHYSEVMTDLSIKFATSITKDGIRDIHADMIHLTADIVCKCLFDKLPSETGIDLVNNLEETATSFQNRRTEVIKLPHWFPTANNRKIKKLVGEIEDVVMTYLDQELHAETPSKTLLSLLIHSKGEDGQQLSRQELRDEAMTLFLAGHETTALSVTWALYELSRNREVYNKLRHEVDTVLQGRRFTLDDMKRVPYAQAVLNESLRKYPPASSIPRQLSGNFDLRGITIPKGTHFVISPFVLHRNEKYFPNSEAFEPERWLDGLEHSLPKCQYIPFGAGPRVCIGNTFALAEGLSILVTIAQKLDISQQQPYSRKPLQQITLRPDADVPLKVSRRQ